MRIGICSANLGGFAVPKDLEYIGVDKGAEMLLAQGITPSFAIGDFDSITDPEVLKSIKEIRTLPERKDVTDTHAALAWAAEHGYDEIYIFGATGGRLDHFLAVLALLELYKDIRIIIKDSQNEITLLKEGRHEFEAGGYKYFSLYAPDEAVISISGAEYNLENYTLKRSDPLCCSNQVKEKCAAVTTSAALLLVRSNDLSS